MFTVLRKKNAILKYILSNLSDADKNFYEKEYSLDRSKHYELLIEISRNLNAGQVLKEKIDYYLELKQRNNTMFRFFGISFLIALLHSFIFFSECGLHL